MTATTAPCFGELAPSVPFDRQAPYSVAASEKRPHFLAALNALTRWHARRCEPYDRMVSHLFDTEAETIETLAYIPARLFKMQRLSSVADAYIVKTLHSSGTTGQAVSQIVLDRETASRQTRALVSIMTSFLGSRRLPMVIVDQPQNADARIGMNARTAGIVGFSTFGRNHFHCLDSQLGPRTEELASFLARHREGPILTFGFTFVVWQQLIEATRTLGYRFDFGPGSILVHGGGWKRLADRQVLNDDFKAAVREQLGIEHIHNYYGMVEQVGSIFMECEYGYLHCPNFADVVVRDARTLSPLPQGSTGLIQVLSALPLSYPGHSVLTEDLGVIHGEDCCPCGRLGRHFTVSGRLAQSELRGCSDTRVMG